MFKSKTFAFGKNWERFIKKYGDSEGLNRRLEIAKKSIADFMNVDNLKGRLFLDVGCGSGIFSLAAFDLGADVVSFDVDPFSVKGCEFYREKRGNPTNWKVYQGSVLDNNFLRTLPKADIVYSHGVLHHTGAMWQAMTNVKNLVKEDGYLYIAIYNKMYGWFNGSRAWQIKKQIYGHLPRVLQYLWEGFYFFRHALLPFIIRLKNPLKNLQNFYKKRGEDVWVDIRDWLGGYPYEYARPDEVFDFYKNEFTLVNLFTKNTLALNIFLFKKK